MEASINDIVVTQENDARPPPTALGINVEIPKFPQYAVYAKRMESFDAWPECSPVQKDDLVAAGLVYTGDGDSVRCYFCGGGLMNWEQDDVPMIEHLKRYRKCPKGHEYAEKACRGIIKPIRNSSVKIDQLDTDVAQACIEIGGFPKEMVKKAIDTFRKRYGHFIYFPKDLFEIMSEFIQEPKRGSDIQDDIKREDGVLPMMKIRADVGRHTTFQKLEWIGKGKNNRSSGVPDWATSLIKKLMNLVDDTLKTATDIMSLLVKRCPQLFPDLTREPTEKDLVTFAEAIGDNFRFLGLALGLSDAKLDQISLDNPTTVLKSYNMLREWVGKTPLQATVSSLIQTMKSCRSVKIDWNEVGKVCMSSRCLMTRTAI